MASSCGEEDPDTGLCCGPPGAIVGCGDGSVRLFDQVRESR
jgi:hypothetical protein